MFAHTCLSPHSTSSYVLPALLLVPVPTTWAFRPPFPRPGAPRATHMMQPRAQMSDWQECPFSEHYLRSQEVRGPAEHSGSITGAEEDWGASHQTRPTCTHPESRSELPVTCGSGPWPHPGGQPQVSSLHLHVLVQEEVTLWSLWRGMQRAMRKERGFSGSPPSPRPEAAL